MTVKLYYLVKLFYKDLLFNLNYRKYISIPLAQKDKETSSRYLKNANKTSLSRFSDIFYGHVLSGVLVDLILFNNRMKKGLLTVSLHYSMR